MLTEQEMETRGFTDEEKMRARMLNEQERDGMKSREALEQKYGKVYDTGELVADFEVLGFRAPFVVVRRKSDGMKGSLMFQHAPRYYYSFEPAGEI